MVFKPGNNANPGGKPKERLWGDAIKAAMRDHTNELDLRMAAKKIAQKLVRAADDGDIVALKEIGNRLDGAPDAHQTHEHTGSITHEHKPISETADFLTAAIGTGQVGASTKPVLQ